jgi:hypothetical protein
MGQINSKLDIKDTTQAMQEFAKQTEYMNMREDLLDDALMDGALGHLGQRMAVSLRTPLYHTAFDGDEEEEADSIVNQVLSEIGLDVGSKVWLVAAPRRPPAAGGPPPWDAEYFLQMADAPSAIPAVASAEAESDQSAADIERRLAKLQLP